MSASTPLLDIEPSINHMRDAKKLKVTYTNVSTAAADTQTFMTEDPAWSWTRNCPDIGAGLDKATKALKAALMNDDFPLLYLSSEQIRFRLKFRVLNRQLVQQLYR